MKSENRSLASIALASLLLCVSALSANAITPFFIKMANATNATSAQLIGVALITPPDAPDSPFTVYGTNLIFGGNSATNFTIALDGTGYSSNALFPGSYRFTFTNLNATLVANIPDTTNFLSLSLYISNVPVFSGLSLNSYQLLTNLLGFAPAPATPAGITNALAFVPANAAYTNDFARATRAGITNSLAFIPADAAMTNAYALLSGLGTIAIRGSNEYALAASLGTIAIRGSNEYALVASLGTIAGRGSNEYALVTADGLSLAVGARTDVKVITNGAIVFIAYKTNNLPGSAFTNYPNGSIMATTNGAFFGLTNLLWKPIEL